MSTKKSAGEKRAAVGTFETADRPEKIRNVALVGHSGSGKTTLVEALLAATGTITRAGTVADGNDGQRFRSGRGRPAALGRPGGLPAAPRRHRRQPPRHPGLPGLHRRAAGRAAGRRRGAVRGVGGRRHRPDHLDAVGGVRGARHAARGRHHPAGRPAGLLRRLRSRPASGVFGGADGQAVLPLYLPVGARARDGAGGPGRPAEPPGLRLRGRVPAEGVRPDRRRRRLLATSSRRGMRSSRRSSTTARTRVCSTATCPARTSAFDVLIDDLETAVARGTFYPVAAGVLGHAVWVWASCWRSSAAASRRRSSSTRRPSRTVTGTPGQTDPVRPGRTAARRGHPHLGRPLPGPAVHPADLLRHADSGQRDPHLRTRRRVARASGPRHRRAGRPDLLAARRHAAPDRQGGRR